MNWSKYTYIFKSEKHGYLLYNSLTNSFAEIDGETFNVFENIRNKVGAITDYLSQEEINQLRKAKIIVDNDYDEYLDIKFQRHMKRFKRDTMTLTIAPTLHCNLACSYCFEASRPKVYMTDETENDIIRFIKRHKEVKKLSITWYGGEPLLSFDRIVSLTEKIESLGIKYFSSIITNGYLLNQEVVNSLVDLKMKQVHVTIDGPEEIHNQRRPHVKEKDSFEVIYNNLLRLKPLVGDNKISLSVRVNVDHTNDDFYHEIYRKIKNDFEGMKVSVYAGIVKKSYGSCSSVNDALMDNQEQANFNIEQYKKHGITNSLFFPLKVNGECMARQIYGYLIDARGDIYKCWTDVGNKTEIVGNVSNNDAVNTTKMTRYLTGADIFDRQECQECFFLPVCGGGCPHLAIKKMMFDEQVNLCLIAKGNLEKFLEIYYEIKTAKNY